MVEDLGEGGRSLDGKRQVGGLGEGSRREGVGAMVEHLLSEVGTVDVCLDAQVAEHGVGFPAPKELDGVFVDVGTEERGSSTWAETAGGEQCRVDAGERSDGFGGVAESRGDLGASHSPADVFGVVVEADGCGRIGFVIAEVLRESEQCFYGAYVRVGGRALCDLFATDGVLLVSEGERGMRDVGYVYVIQRGVRGAEYAIPDGKVYVVKLEGLRAARAGGVGVLGRAHEPEESGDGEVGAMAVEGSMDGMVVVKDLDQLTEDFDVGRVGAFGGVVFVAEALEERSEYGMVPVGSRNFFSGIWLTQVGDPRPHRQ